MKNYTKDEILSILKSTDRTAILSYRDARERVLSNEVLKLKRENMCREGDRLRNIPTAAIPFSVFKRFETDGDRSEYEFGDKGYFIRRRKLEAYGLLAWLYERPADISALEDIIWAILDEYTWALPAHLHGNGLKVLQNDGYMVDLFAAETGEALSEILVLVGDKLHPIVVERTHRLIRERILDRMNSKFHWMNGSNNWVAVCGGSVGITAMYECTDDCELAGILNTILNSLHGYLGGFTDDGVCLEGMGYWRYGFGYFMAFAELLCRRTDGKINLFDDEKVHRVAAFLLRCIFKGGRCVSFSDSGTRAEVSLFAVSKLPEIYPDIPLAAAELVDMRYPEDGCSRFALELRNLIWAAESLPTEAECLGTHIFNDAQWYISETESGTGIAAKAGHNEEPHNHNDVGSFEIYKNGEELLADLGSGKYDRDYFRPDTRYTILCNASFGHSVPIVNGTYQQVGRQFAAKNVSIDETGITSDISGAYPVPTLDSLVRDIRFDSTSGAATLTDTYSFTEIPEFVVERFVTRVAPEITGNNVIIKSGSETLTLTCPDGVDIAVSMLEHCDHSGRMIPVYAIDCTVRDLQNQFILKFEMR